MALHFGCLPTELDPEQVKDYLYELQQRSKTPSQTYFKHTVYGLRFLLKTEGLPYAHLHLPEIARPKTLPVILSRQEMMDHANIDSTMIYLHVCQTSDQLPSSPLDKVFFLGGPKQVIEYLGRYTHKTGYNSLPSAFSKK